MRCICSIINCCWCGCLQLDGNPELRDLFVEAGINEAQLKEDKEMSKFVMEFLDKRGGLDAVKRERERERERAARPLPAPPPSVPSVPPSQPPSFSTTSHTSRPPPPAGNCRFISFRKCCRHIVQPLDCVIPSLIYHIVSVLKTQA